jgi:hypothetical protein
MVINEMSSSSFINALRRFVALRGEVKLIRSDCGTNFIGAAKCMDAKVINVESSVYKSLGEKASNENVSTVCLVFIVNNVDGVRGVTKSVSSGMPAIGLEFTIWQTSAINAKD